MLCFGELFVLQIALNECAVQIAILLVVNERLVQAVGHLLNEVDVALLVLEGRAQHLFRHPMLAADLLQLGDAAVVLQHVRPPEFLVAPLLSLFLLILVQLLENLDLQVLGLQVFSVPFDQLRSEVLDPISDPVLLPQVQSIDQVDLLPLNLLPLACQRFKKLRFVLRDLLHVLLPLDRTGLILLL